MISLVLVVVIVVGDDGLKSYTQQHTFDPGGVKQLNFTQKRMEKTPKMKFLGGTLIISDPGKEKKRKKITLI